MSSMATRSAKKAAGIGKKAPARKPRATRSQVNTSDAWTLQTREDQHEDDDDEPHRESAPRHYNGHLTVATRQELDQDEEEPHYNGHLTVATRPELDHDEDEDTHVHSTIEPLSQMADMAERVGREVETFAENLDKFLDNLPTRNKFDAVQELVTEFGNIAKDAAFRVRKEHEHHRALQLRQEWNDQTNVLARSAPFSAITRSKLDSSLSQRDAESVKEWRRWQQEADLWDLFNIVLDLHHNPNQHAVSEEKEEQLRALGPLHRYTPEKDVWKHFVLQDNLAKERQQVKTWLERTVDHQQSDLRDISKELQLKAGQGSGAWSQGWTQTRLKVKQQKRMNQLSLDGPGITRLDPDATSRQTKALEEDDAFLERSMWVMCWEMLRRGTSWQEVSKWCVGHNEGWRAISVGKGSDDADALSKTRWRHICFLASQSSTASEWEAAVYGLLGGNFKAVHKICRNVDDRLYAHYSAALIQQFEQFLVKKVPDSQPRPRLPNDDALRDPQQQIVDLVLTLRREASTSNESIQPMKIIQSYLLANDLGSMIHTLGFAIAYTDALRDQGEDMIIHLRPWWPEDANQPEAEIALDPQTLRMAIHMSIVLRELTNEKLEGDERDAEENVIVAYIQALRAAGQRELIPLYASRLSRGRYVVTMARVLEDVTSAREQEQTLALLHNYQLDNILIVNEHIAGLLSQHIASSYQDPRPLKMLEKINETHLYPGQRIVKGFLPESTSESDTAIVRSLQWYNIIKGHWRETFFNMSQALRKCLVAGRLACALSIVHEFPYEHLAIRKAYQVTGKSINPMDHDGTFPANEQATWELMIRQSKTYYELEQLVRAIKALSDWRSQEAEICERKGGHLNVSTNPPGLKRAKEEVDEAIAMILTGRILQEAATSDEASDLEFIRTNYIPEIVLAYNTVLHTAGSLISRDNLIESMDLSVTVADEANGLTECFTAAGRMRELVTSFAQTSKAMLVLKSRKQWKPRKDNGKDLGIWETVLHNGGQSYADRDVSL